jgi:sulfatase maturation enzyme AslB (radical SAM superfamily)
MLPGKVTAPDYPENVVIEPTNACNLRCRMCSEWGEGVTSRREVGFIARGIWTKALDEIGAWPVRVNLHLTGAGEPLLHPEFLDMLRYAKGKGNISVGFLCNATLLNSVRAESVAGLKIDQVGFSVDGAQQEIFEHYRVGATLSEVDENIERLLSLRKADTPRVYLNMVAHQEADIGRFVERWKGKVDVIQVSVKRPVDRSLNRRIVLKKPCPSLDQTLVMGWSGHVVLCCYAGSADYAKYLIGKFPEENLRDIWCGEPMNRARMLHRMSRPDEIGLCRNCDSDMFHGWFEMDLEKTHIRVELPYIRSEWGYYPET